MLQKVQALTKCCTKCLRFVKVYPYQVNGGLTLSPLNEIMDHSNTALLVIPNFEFVEFLPMLLPNSKHSTVNVFAFSNC